MILFSYWLGRAGAIFAKNGLRSDLGSELSDRSIRVTKLCKSQTSPSGPCRDTCAVNEAG